ncbi:hypothetical protein [Frankia sp. R82]|uniref:hypothetical protein n=1 Tax=Frankia sp. R82 TaxID=2950553 RepID=UPI0020435DD5|nr:hypothetical protein [Frankia sp. R82]MCM3885043.1 hypothetical protein [Frankia sp. R82]
MRRLDPNEAKQKMIECGAWPIAPFANTQDKWLCVCMTCGEFVEPRYNNVVNKGAGGCRRCGTVKAINHLRLDPEMAKKEMIERGVWPIESFDRTLAPWPSVCMECGSFISPTYANVVSRGQGGCRECARRDRGIDPEVAKSEMINSGVWPVADFVNTSVPWLCVCMVCGEFVRPRYNSVVHKGNGGCEKCGRREVNPEVAKATMIAHGMWPVAPFRRTVDPWLCVCMECGEFIMPRYAGTARRASGCKFCKGKAINPDTAKKKMIERGYWPIVEITASHVPCMSICMGCGDVVTPRYDSVVSSGQGGCPNCSTSGFRDTDPALIYLLIRETVAKIGICNIGSPRLQQHVRKGWDVYATYAVKTGAEARLAEKVTLECWRVRGVGWGFVLDLDGERYDGYTETVSLVRRDGTETPIRLLWQDILVAVEVG